VNTTCQICKTGKLHPGHTQVTLNRGESVIIIKNVPANICDNCAEYYLDEKTALRVSAMGQEAVKNGAELEIRKFQAA
jgi:YgiT-type zinc finger domain-containing protein